jgi:hypothetical protein
MKSAQVDNQPYDFAVEINDSEESEFDKEADEVNVPQSIQLAGQKQPQNNQHGSPLSPCKTRFAVMRDAK